jgi:hypothetical protein
MAISAIDTQLACMVAVAEKDRLKRRYALAIPIA